MEESALTKRDMSGRQKILLIDDDVEALAILNRALSETFEVTSENSGAKAVLTAAHVRPSLILLDINMPNIDGYEVLRQIRLNSATCTTPVICMSSDLTAETRDRVYGLGAVGYLQKPLEFKTIDRDVQALFRAINSIKVSVSGRRSYCIAFNPSEKKHLLKEKITTILESNPSEKVILLTLDNGDDFNDPEMNKWINSKRLIFLQVAPALISKFPYLQDLSPVIADIRGFMDDLSDVYTLVVDDFHLIVNVQDPKQAIGRLHLIKEEFSKLCRQMFFFSSRSNQADEMVLLNEFADIICR